MQRLKQAWNNWQWLLPVGALIISAFTWYYKTTTVTPARITACEQKLDTHIVEADQRFKQIEKAQNNIDISLGRLEAMTAILLEDMGILKRYVTDEAHHERIY